MRDDPDFDDIPPQPDFDDGYDAAIDDCLAAISAHMDGPCDPHLIAFAGQIADYKVHKPRADRPYKDRIVELLTANKAYLKRARVAEAENATLRDALHGSEPGEMAERQTEMREAQAFFAGRESAADSDAQDRQEVR